ncbi:MAG: leucine-rich repeat protein [Bacteroides sp.]|nr:leucine-rich repeat protein [Bacteroides sp.]
MEYPLISEYREAVLSAEDSFKEFSSLRPVLDGRGDPVMSSGNFAVIFKMRDERDGKLYAVKCFTKDQERRNESYRRIADELESVVAPYVLPLRYLEDELFVDSPQCEREEFPVVLMDWVEGETLSAYIERNIADRYALEMLSYRFNRMAAWLLTQPFAHGDLKPDNILVREDGSLVLVDYDGMFVSAMKGEPAREAGSPDYRHPERTDRDFNGGLDDFSIAVIALSLRAIALKPELWKLSTADALFFTERDFRDPASSAMLKEVQALTSDKELSVLLGAFFIALANNSLDLLSFRTFMTAKPEKPKVIDLPNPEIIEVEEIDTSVTKEEIANGVKDEFGVIYSRDGKRLLKCPDGLKLSNYNIKAGTKVICNGAFFNCSSLHSVDIPSSVTSIGNSAFLGCHSLQSVTIPSSVKVLGANPFHRCELLHLSLAEKSDFILIDGLLIDSKGVLISCLNHSSMITIPSSVTSIGDWAFDECDSLHSVDIPSSVTSIGYSTFGKCSSLQSVTIPSSVTSIGDWAFKDCISLQNIDIPSSVTSIGDSAFWECHSLQSVTIPSSVTSIGKSAFFRCRSLQSVSIPSSVTSIGNDAFEFCISLQSVTIPSSVTSIGDSAFSRCRSLQSIDIPSSVTSIGDSAFKGCESLRSVTIPSSVKSIGDSAFVMCDSLHSIDIPSSVKSIGDSAFSRCRSLQRVDILSSVTSIGVHAFWECYSLQSVTIPASLNVDEKKVFPSYCKVIRRK